MKIRVKKKNADGIVRLETSGKIKEFIIGEDLLRPQDVNLSICFKGKDSSGIVDLSFSELQDLFKEVMPKVDSLKSVKVMKFDK
jgi:hypothetical protein